MKVYRKRGVLPDESGVLLAVTRPDGTTEQAKYRSLGITVAMTQRLAEKLPQDGEVSTFTIREAEEPDVVRATVTRLRDGVIETRVAA